jgi:hypothetical protein
MPNPARNSRQSRRRRHSWSSRPPARRRSRPRRPSLRVPRTPAPFDPAAGRCAPSAARKAGASTFRSAIGGAQSRRRRRTPSRAAASSASTRAARARSASSAARSASISSGRSSRAVAMPRSNHETRRLARKNCPLVIRRAAAGTYGAGSARQFRRAATHRDAPIADGDLSGAEEIEVTNPGHPLYGRRFRLLTVTSGVRSAQLARVVYRPDIFLLLPISATSLHPPTPRSVPTKLCWEALEDLLRVTVEREGECRSTPTTSGEACRPACAGRSRTTSPPCSGR